MSSSTQGHTPQGPGAVTGAPNLPATFTDTFTSRYIQAGDVRLHAVVGGEGPPLLLVHGWPETWYAWRLLMPARCAKRCPTCPTHGWTGSTSHTATGS